MRSLSYQVLGRGDIIFTNTVEIPNRKSHAITFLATFAMLPKAHFIVHYIKDNEVISDRLEIDLGDDLQNFVSFFFLGFFFVFSIQIFGSVNLTSLMNMCVRLSLMYQRIRLVPGRKSI